MSELYRIAFDSKAILTFEPAPQPTLVGRLFQPSLLQTNSWTQGGCTRSGKRGPRVSPAAVIALSFFLRNSPTFPGQVSQVSGLDAEQRYHRGDRGGPDIFVEDIQNNRLPLLTLHSWTFRSKPRSSERRK